MHTSTHAYGHAHTAFCAMKAHINMHADMRTHNTDPHARAIEHGHGHVSTGQTQTCTRALEHHASLTEQSKHTHTHTDTRIHIQRTVQTHRPHGLAAHTRKHEMHLYVRGSCIRIFVNPSGLSPGQF